jgi:hypothetical protein
MPVVPQAVAPAASPSASSCAQDPDKNPDFVALNAFGGRVVGDFAATCRAGCVAAQGEAAGATDLDLRGRRGSPASLGIDRLGAARLQSFRSCGARHDQGRPHRSRPNARGFEIEPRAFALDRRGERLRHGRRGARAGQGARAGCGCGCGRRGSAGLPRWRARGRGGTFRLAGRSWLCCRRRFRRRQRRPGRPASPRTTRGCARGCCRTRRCRSCRPPRRRGRP